MSIVTEIKKKPYWSDQELYYRCDYETYRRLKTLHKWFWQTHREFGNYFRWFRKEPQNRKGDKPSYCEFFRYRKGYWFNCVAANLKDHGIVRLYHEARKPSKEPVEVFNHSQIEEINLMYEKASEYFT